MLAEPNGLLAGNSRLNEVKRYSWEWSMELQLASGLVDSCLALFWAFQWDRSLVLGVCELSPELAPDKPLGSSSRAVIVCSFSMPQ